MSTTGKRGADSPYLELGRLWRSALAFVGVIAVLFSALLFLVPPSRWASEHDATGALVKSSNSQADPTTFSLALLIFGGIVLVFAANG